MLTRRMMPTLLAAAAASWIAFSGCAHATAAPSSMSFHEARIRKNPAAKLVSRLSMHSRSALLAHYGAKADVTASWDKGCFTGISVTAIGKVTVNVSPQGHQGFVGRCAACPTQRSAAGERPCRTTVLRCVHHQHTVAQARACLPCGEVLCHVNTIAWSNSMPSQQAQSRQC